MNEGMNEENQIREEGITTMGRRGFLKTAGLGAAAAGTTLAAGCRKPVQYIIPYGKRPEDVIPGKPVYYATGFSVGTTVSPITIESHDGRPTKVEGNPAHPLSQGGTSGYAQASVLDLYDPDRSKAAQAGLVSKTLEEVAAELKSTSDQLKSNGGKGFAILTQWNPSPSFARALGELKTSMPNAVFYVHDPMWASQAHEGSQMVNLSGVSTTLQLDKAKVIVSLDSDFLGTDGDTCFQTRGFTRGRQIDENPELFNRLYSVEPRYTLTGTSADHRLQIRGEQIGEFLAELAQALKSKGVAVPAGAELPVPKLDAGVNSERAAKWIAAVTDDLIANKGQSVVVIGNRQPAHVHALGHLVNYMIGAFGKTITMSNSLDLPIEGDLNVLGDAIDNGAIETLLVLGSNPVYTGTADVDFKTKLSTVKKSIHLGHNRDETGYACSWHLPMSHYLESWGDLQGTDGSVLIQQPLIAPLYESHSALEVLLAISGNEKSAYDYVQETWLKAPQATPPFLSEKKNALSTAEEALKGAESEKAQIEATGTESPEGVENTESPLSVATAKVERAKAAVDAAQKDLTAAEEAAETAAKEAELKRKSSWARWIQRGIVDNENLVPQVAFSWEKIAGAWAGRTVAKVNEIELNFVIDYTIGDGRFANNAWLQEMPEPITKITWDNAASISKSMADSLGVKTGDMIRIEANERSLEIAACVTHGVAENVIVLPLGYGRERGGQFAYDAGFNAYSIQNGTKSIQTGATVTKGDGAYLLAITQLEKGDFSEEIRTRIDGIIRKNTKEGYTQENVDIPVGDQVPSVKKYEVMPKEKLKSLFDVPKGLDSDKAWNETGQQWGMTIDLTSCTGCNACSLACNAENNVPIVGKGEVANGREMHWLRMDRYFDGEEQNPASDCMPLSCTHCENAPCETVCPVAATAHGPEGTNDIAYNRCIGTRYCANNCPYKVRRFNYYNFSKRMDERFGPLIAMVRNPDVTVRFRGVIEKCSYCVQRINEAHIEAKTTGDRTGIVPDGALQPACGQACNSGAIVFGDINDPNSAVSKKKASARNYALLAELNIHPRTTYLARIQNPNPALVEG